MEGRSMSKAHEIAKAYRGEAGFWLYLMTDCLLFGSLFATYAVLRGATAGGPTEAELFEMPMVLAQTLILLASTLTTGLMLVAMRQKRSSEFIAWLVLTIAFGISFLSLELHEFSTLVAEGQSWQASASRSAFFALVGTHGLHIAVGLLWAAVLLISYLRRGFTTKIVRQAKLFALFWHFLDVIWIFIFTFVYLIGVSNGL